MPTSASAAPSTPGFGDLLEYVGAIVVVLDPEGRIVHLNRAGRELTGYADAEVHGSLIWDLLLLPEEVGQVRDVFRELVTKARASTFENHWVAKDGRRARIGLSCRKRFRSSASSWAVA